MNTPLIGNNIKEYNNIKEGAAAPDEVTKKFEFPIPKSLADSEKFMEVWADWEGHLKEKRKKLTSFARKQQLEHCEKWGVDRAARAIRESIRNNWQGLFEEKYDKKAGNQEKTNRTGVSFDSSDIPDNT